MSRIARNQAPAAWATSTHVPCNKNRIGLIQDNYERYGIVIILTIHDSLISCNNHVYESIFAK